MKKILAIESSCDESSISLIEGDKIIDTITFSQEDEFSKIGGVVPEIASRLHEVNIPLVLDKIISDNNLDLKTLDSVAVTTSPGLIGCLQMGLQVAKTLSAQLEIPLISVHHIAGHVYSGEIDNEYEYPLLSLVVSGGNTQLILVKEEMDFKIIGSTVDDAVGECFDKVARALAFGYPGGPKIDNAAKIGKSNIDFPVSEINKYDFSYSGLKSAVLNHINSAKMKKQDINKNDIACSFQKAAIKQLVQQTNKAINNYNVKQLVVVGGVSANSLLRKSFSNLNIKIIFPRIELCTDNAAMIAKVAYKKHKLKKFETLELDSNPGELIKF